MSEKQAQATCPTLTSSAAGFHARISATPERALDWTEHAAACGSSTSESFAIFDPDSSSWKTSQRSLLEGWTSFSDRWPKAGMMRSGQVYELPTLALHTDASGCSSWATPRHEGFDAGAHRGTPDSLHAQVKQWPTPDAMVANDGESLETWHARRERCKAKHNNGNGFGTPLAVAVRLHWPTPTSGKASGSAGYSTDSGRHAGVTLTDATVRRVWTTPTVGVNRPTSQASLNKGFGPTLDNQVPGKLNPAWVMPSFRSVLR